MSEQAAHEERLAELWEEHIRHEFDTKNTEATIGTMVADSYVNHIPVMAGRSLFDDDLAGHAGPIVVGASERKTPGLFWHKGEILGLAGLNHDLGLVGVERRIGAGLDRTEKFGRGEFVRLLAVVFEV